MIDVCYTFHQSVDLQKVSRLILHIGLPSRMIKVTLKYSVPKSCKTCRTAKKLTTSSSLLTADDIRINEQLASLMATDPHEDEVADG